MDSVMKWGMSLCCAALAGGVAQILSPGGSMERIFRITLSVFFLCCVVSPFNGFSGNFSLEESGILLQDREEEAALELSDAADKIFYRSAAEKLELLAQKKLEQMGINDAKLSVYITETDHQLTAEDIVVEAVLPKECKDRHDEICTRLGYELGTTLRIGYTDGEGENSGA